MLKLGKMKNIYGWSFCITIGVLMGAALWYISENGDFNVKPVKEPALEVSDHQRNKVQEEKTVTHIVRDGENLSQIAEKYRIDVDTLRGANEALDELIEPGQELLILPKKGVLYQVEQGDSIWDIARRFNVDVKVILQSNQRNSDLIESGEKLFIPGVKPLDKYSHHTPVSRNAEAKFILPATGEVSSPFGQRWGKAHQGVDIADDYGTPVVASLSGRVSYAGWISGYGYSVMLEHRNGYSTLYGHMQSILVNSGQTVGQGEVIGKMGSTGNSTGPHVHFEVRKNGEIIDPVHVLR